MIAADSAVVAPPESGTPGWIPVPSCCWCGGPFTEMEIDRGRAWVCQTPSCFERQMVWKRIDKSGRLFHLPMPKQVELREAIASQQYGAICIGGERGGGKSKELRMIAFDACKDHEGFSVRLLRREFPQLYRNHMRFVPREAKRIGATFSGKVVKFPENDSELEFGHCQDPDDFKNYIGDEADLVIFDQIELFTQEQVVEISAATGRTRRDDWRGLVLAGENPGGPLSAFVSEMYIDKNLDRERYPDYDPNDFCFIASRLEDNPYTDDRYVKRLALLSPERRQMFRFGRRDVFPGQYFKNFNVPGRVEKLDIR